MVWGEQWICPCGTHNFFMRTKCRDCGTGRPEDAEVESVGAVLSRAHRSPPFTALDCLDADKITGGTVPLTSEPWALVMDADDEPRFHVELCDEQSLFGTVYAAMYHGKQTLENIEHVTAVIGELQESGSIRFEDGWLELRKGAPAIVEFLITKAKEIAEDRDQHDTERCENLRRAEKAEVALRNLKTTLRDLLAPNAENINALVS